MPGLLGCHVSKCSGHKLGRFGSPAFAGKSRSDTKAHEPALAGDGVDQNIGRLDVLVDNAALMQVIDRARNADSKTQRECHVQRMAEQLIESDTARVLQDQYRTVPVSSNRNWSRSPR